MAPTPIPYRTLGLPRGASLDEVKRAYRRLAKANHPDAAGEAALPRFLAIQAAYEQLVGAGAAAARAGAPPRDPAPMGRRPWPATTPSGWRRTRARRPAPGRAAARPGDARTRGRGTGGASGPATAGRTAAVPTGSGGRAAAAAATHRAGAVGPRPSGDDRRRRRRRRGRPPDKATLGSTSYDGADAGPFEPDWGGATWYGTTSGTYWTINPKEYADPRKHGPEYQARARRAARSAAAGPADRRRRRPRRRATDRTPRTSRCRRRPRPPRPRRRVRRGLDRGRSAPAHTTLPVGSTAGTHGPTRGRPPSRRRRRDAPAAARPPTGRPHRPSRPPPPDLGRAAADSRGP